MVTVARTQGTVRAAGAGSGEEILREGGQQTLNILGFAGLMSSFAAIQFCCCRTKAFIDNV